jgi:hypothetical protein
MDGTGGGEQNTEQSGRSSCSEHVRAAAGTAHGGQSVGGRHLSNARFSGFRLIRQRTVHCTDCLNSRAHLLITILE